MPINKSRNEKHTDTATAQLPVAQETRKLEILSRSAMYVELDCPPDEVWRRLESSIDSRQNSRFPLFHWIGGVAVSLALCFLTFITYQNVSIQSELEDLRLSNQLLEYELNNIQQDRELTSEMLRQILFAEQQMQNTNDKKELLKLLKHRQVAMKAILEIEQMEKEHEIIFL